MLACPISSPFSRGIPLDLKLAIYIYMQNSGIPWWVAAHSLPTIGSSIWSTIWILLDLELRRSCMTASKREHAGIARRTQHPVNSLHLRIGAAVPQHFSPPDREKSFTVTVGKRNKLSCVVEPLSISILTCGIEGIASSRPRQSADRTLPRVDRQ